MSLVLRFCIQLLLVLLGVFMIHVVFLHLGHQALFENKIFAAYTVNFLMAAGTIWALIGLNKWFSSSLGFLFMAGSFLKFGLFFTLFYPSYIEDGVITKVEFAAFFTPYAIGLILEVRFLLKILNA